MTAAELANEMMDHAGELRFITNHSNPGAECPEADALAQAAGLLREWLRSHGLPTQPPTE